MVDGPFRFHITFRLFNKRDTVDAYACTCNNAISVLQRYTVQVFPRVNNIDTTAKRYY